MIANKKIILASVIIVTFLCGFSGRKQEKYVTLHCLNDTVYFNKRLADSLNLTFIIKFNLVVKNYSNRKFQIHEESLIRGYYDSYDDYYLDIFKIVNDKKVPSNYSRILHTSAEFPGKMIDLNPGETKVYYGTSNIYKIKEAGKYYIQAIFDGKYKFLGQSTVDSVIVIDTSAAY